MNKADEIIKKLDTSAKMSTSLTDWRPILAQECQVYVCGESYIAKKFDQINYRFCGEREAASVLRDNLYALLRFKYFPTPSEEVDEKIQKIIASFMINLKTTLKKVSFDRDNDGDFIQLIPDYCCAFRNGVYDFKNDKWLFKYDVIKMERLSNNIYLYDRMYAVTWYLNFDFKPMPIKIMNVDLDELVEAFKELTKVNRNYCFELMYNMSHDIVDQFSLERFNHLAEIMGYTMLNSFTQKFVMLIGAGGNGKNSLFDGCFTYKLAPRPASESLDDIATDRFITGVLENRHLNLFLESSNQETSIGYKESKPLKNITGSPNQSIEHKGVDAYSGIINCKHMWSANDQDKVKFTDTTQGFRRRINLFETWFTWDEKKRFMQKGDYYDTTFSEDLHELTDDLTNTIAYVYLAMFGIKTATKNFTAQFRFTSNDWKLTYTDIDISLKEKLEKITISDVLSYVRRSKVTYEECKALFYDINKTKLYMSPTMCELGYDTYDKMLNMFSDDEKVVSYFTENDVYISVRILQYLCADLSSATSFTQSLKKLYSITSMQMLGANKPYVKCTFIGKKLKILT